jgi:hypothetical protein
LPAPNGTSTDIIAPVKDSVAGKQDTLTILGLGGLVGN